MEKTDRYGSRDEIEEIVKAKNIDRTHFREYSKTEYEKVIRKFYYSFCDYEKYPEISLVYVWRRFRSDLTATAPVLPSDKHSSVLRSIKEQMEYDWTRKLFLIVDDGWVYEGYIDEIITVLSEALDASWSAVEDFCIVTPQYDTMAAFCEDGESLVVYRNK